jgi:hypothetical protein
MTRPGRILQALPAKFTVSFAPAVYAVFANIKLLGNQRGWIAVLNMQPGYLDSELHGKWRYFPGQAFSFFSWFFSFV